MTTVPVREEPGRIYGEPRTENISLFWLNARCAKSRSSWPVHWSRKRPELHQIDFCCVGVLNHKKGNFEVQGVIVDGELPRMNVEERRLMIEELRLRLEEHLGCDVYRIMSSVFE